MASNYKRSKQVFINGQAYVPISKVNRKQRPPTPPDKERIRTSNEALTEDQVNRLIAACDNLFDRTILILGFGSGMRVSEISSIETGRIDWENNRINVWDEKKDDNRNVYPGQSAMDALRLYISEYKVKGPLVFDYVDKTFENHVKAITKRVLNDKRSWHTVRHTYVTLCAKRGTDIKIVCGNTGDKPETILKVYNNPSVEMMKEAADKTLKFII